MATTTNRPKDSQGPLIAASALAIASLSADLEIMVYQFEADWQERRIVSQEAASRLHELRDRAQQLIGGQDSA